MSDSICASNVHARCVYKLDDDDEMRLATYLVEGRRSNDVPSDASSALASRLYRVQKQQHSDSGTAREQRRRYVYEPLKESELGPETAAPVAQVYKRACLRCDRQYVTDTRFERLCVQCHVYIGSVSPQWVGF